MYLKYNIHFYLRHLTSLSIQSAYDWEWNGSGTNKIRIEWWMFMEAYEMIAITICGRRIRVRRIIT